MIHTASPIRRQICSLLPARVSRPPHRPSNLVFNLRLNGPQTPHCSASAALLDSAVPLRPLKRHRLSTAITVILYSLALNPVGWRGQCNLIPHPPDTGSWSMAAWVALFAHSAHELDIARAAPGCVHAAKHDLKTMLQSQTRCKEDASCMQIGSRKAFQPRSVVWNLEPCIWKHPWRRYPTRSSVGSRYYSPVCYASSILISRDISNKAALPSTCALRATFDPWPSSSMR